MSFIPVLLLLFALSSTLAEKTTPDASTLRTKVTTQTTKQTTTPPPSCESKNGTSCEECLLNVNKCMWFWNSLRCLWCIPNKRCLTYPVKTILPPNSLCPLNDARWGLCTINFQILIITLSVAGALLIIGFFICIFCCCKCENIGSGRIEKNMNRKADKRKTKQGERTAELKTRHDEIRQKYGLSRASPYARFENPT